LFSAIISSLTLKQFGFLEPYGQISARLCGRLSFDYFTFGFLDWLEEFI
jgi:hypothetical protein